MTEPTTRPSPTDGIPPGPGPPRVGPSPTVVLVAGIVGLALLVALAARSASPWGPARRGDADLRELVLTVVVAVGATVVAGLAVVSAWHRLVLADRTDGPALRPTILRALPIVLVAAAAVALLAISWTPLEPAPGTDPSTDPPPEDPSGPRLPTTRPADPAEDRRWLDAADLRLAGSVRTGDFDGDGEPDLGVDLDGDGTIDALLQPGDGRGGTGLDGGGRIFVRCEGGTCQAAVDVDGDGWLDQRVRIDGSLSGLGAVDRTLLGQRFGEMGELLVDGRTRDTDVEDPDDPLRDQQDQQDAGDSDEDDDDPIGGAVGRILLLVAGLAVAAVVGAVLVTAFRSMARRTDRDHDDGARVRAPEPDHEAAREQMAASVGDSIDAMVVDPDPRTAIIGAYARLLEGLAASDVARRPQEAPVEHLERALTTLSVRPEPLRALIALFEVARFSTHPLDEPDRVLALQALRAAASDLVATRPPAPVGEPAPT